VTLPAEVRLRWRRVPEGVERRAVSRALLQEMHPAATFVSRCPRCGGPHGRVHVIGADASVSVSYAAGWAVVAADGHGRRIGVDAVAADARGLERVLPRADARSWARVEAVLKADGRGLAVDPGRVRVVEAVAGAHWSGRVDAGGLLAGWDLDGPPGVLVALALGGRPSRAQPQ
jgi:4'-phosphopantetheinyl transferase